MGVHKGYPGVDSGDFGVNGESEYEISIYRFDSDIPMYEPILPKFCHSISRSLFIGYNFCGDGGYNLNVRIEESGQIIDPESPINGCKISKEIHEFCIDLNPSERELVEAIFEGHVATFSEFACISIERLIWKYVFKNPQKDKFSFYKLFPGFSDAWAEAELKETVRVLDSALK